MTYPRPLNAFRVVPPPPPPTLPPIADENATFTDEGTATTGWTASNSIVSSDGTKLRQTKNVGLGTSSSATKSFTFTAANKDYIFYAKIRASVGANNIAAIWFLNGSKEVAIWFGTNNASTTYTANAVSAVGTTGAATRNVGIVVTGASFDTVYVEVALQFDFKFSELNVYLRVAGLWQIVNRIPCDWFSSTQIQLVSTSNSPINSWIEFDYLLFCRPNIMSIGDSICAGRTLFDPNRIFGLGDATSFWQGYNQLYPALRNVIIVNKGVPSESSSQILARIADVDHSVRVVFLHASTNDEILSITKATRSTNIQSTITAILAMNGGTTKAVLLNALYGQVDAADNLPTPDLRDYMLDWWLNYLPAITGHTIAIDIMIPLLSAGFQNSALTQGADKLHPNPAGYQAIYNEIASHA